MFSVIKNVIYIVLPDSVLSFSVKIKATSTNPFRDNEFQDLVVLIYVKNFIICDFHVLVNLLV